MCPLFRRPPGRVCVSLLAGCTWSSCCLLREWLQRLPVWLSWPHVHLHNYVSSRPTVTSHASGLPLDQGRMVVPSRCLPSWRIKPTGSFTALIWARFMARQMISFIWQWHCCLGALLRRARPWRPRASTNLPHLHVCGSHALQPSLWATATLTSSSDCGGLCQNHGFVMFSNLVVPDSLDVLWLSLSLSLSLSLFLLFKVPDSVAHRQSEKQITGNRTINV